MNYSEDILIRHSQIDDQREIKTGPLIDLIQDVEASNIESLTVFNEYNINNEVAIFITYRQIDFIERPLLKDLIKVNTYPYKTNPFYGFRETVLIKNNNPIILVNTLGAFVNFKTGRPTKLPKDIIDSIKHMKPLVPININRKIDISNTSFDLETEIVITKAFIDYYSHVNNSFYILFSESILPSDFYYNQIRTEYRKGLKLGDIAVLRRFKTKNGYYIIVYNKNDLEDIYTIVEFNNIGGVLNVNE